MSGTIKLDDMRLFAKVAEVKSFTAAAQALEVPKQTLSRRIAELEGALGLRLIHRTTRRLQLSDAGARYAERCAEIVRLADDANRAISGADDLPSGTLRVTADPVFGEAFLSPVVIEYARKWPDVRVDVVLTRRRVDLLDESFDLAFRIGHVDDPVLSGRNLGAARVRYCASPQYIARRGAPRSPEDLSKHECLVVASDGAPIRWPFPGPKGPRLVPVTGRLVFSSFTMARDAALAGLGVALFPEYACTDELRRKRLVPVLENCIVDVGSVWLVHLSRRFLPARVRAFVDLARHRFAVPPWLPRSRRRR